jgi:hypothetical protein
MSEKETISVKPKRVTVTLSPLQQRFIQFIQNLRLKKDGLELKETQFLNQLLNQSMHQYEAHLKELDKEVPWLDEEPTS